MLTASACAQLSVRRQVRRGCQISGSAAKRSWLREWWFVWLPLGFLALVAVGYGTYRAILRRRVKASLQAIRDAGYPATPEELDAWYEEPPPGQNAAAVYMQAFGALVEPSADQEQILPLVGEAELPPVGEPMPDDMKAAVRQHLDANAETLRLLHEAASFEQCRYPVDLGQGLAAGMRYLSQIRHCTELLSLTAESRARRGDKAGAAAALMDALALGESLRKEPMLLSQLVRVACHAISADGLEGVLSTGGVPDGSLKELRERVRESIPLGGMETALIGERAIVFWASERLPHEAGPSHLKLVVLDVTGLLELDLVYYLDAMGRVIEVAGKPFPRRLEEARKTASQIEEEIDSALELHYLSAMLFPGVGRAFAEEASAVALLRAAQASLAVERYRLDNRQLPRNLSQLAPEYIDEVPRDPFDGKPLRYKRLEAGYVVYSVGANTTDNGGAETEDERTGDIVFRVTR